MTGNQACLTAWTIQKTLMRKRFHRSFVLPNYTSANWFECDVFEVTAAGYFVEYEVKLTLNDFKADAKKRRHSYGQATAMKHSLLAAADPHGPSRFFFVTPPGLVAVEHRESLDPAAVLPSWAGLIEIERPEWRRSWLATVRVPAPSTLSIIRCS